MTEYRFFWNTFYDLNFQKMSRVMILIIQLKKNQRMIKTTKIGIQIHQTKKKLSSVNFVTKLFNIMQLEKPIWELFMKASITNVQHVTNLLNTKRIWKENYWLYATQKYTLIRGFQTDAKLRSLTKNRPEQNPFGKYICKNFC